MKNDKSKELLKKYKDVIIVLALLALSGFCFWGYEQFDTTEYPILNNIFLQVATSAIISAIAWTVLKRVEKSIHDALEIKSRDKQILEEVRDTGIVHIYSDRGITDKEYRKSLLKHLRKVPDNFTVRILGVTLSKFFGNHFDRDFLNEIFDLLKRGVNFELLMLDPTCEMAQFRAKTNQEKFIKNHGYISSTIFMEAKTSIRRLHFPEHWDSCPENLDEMIHNQIKVRLYNMNPVVHLIILDKYAYIEQYHNGGGKEVKKVLLSSDEYSNRPNFAGIMPVFKVKKESLYYCCMNSHFENIWDSPHAVEHNLSDEGVYEEIFDFTEQQWSKRDENKCL